MRTAGYVMAGLIVVSCRGEAFAQMLKPAQTVAAFPESARVGFLDLDRVAALTREGKAAAAKLQELQSRKTAQVADRGKQVDALQQKLLQSESILSDAVRMRLQREFQRAQLDFSAVHTGRAG